MNVPLQPPERLVRLARETPQMDVARRTIRSVIATRRIARDGGVVLTDGIDARAFAANPVVQALHGVSESGHSPVIGRALSLAINNRAVETLTQFADTELGREYAYLYGLNPDKEIYMRAWSFGWRTLATDRWDQARAARELGEDYDAGDWPPGAAQIWVALRSEMHEYSAVPVGADRAALSRAHQSGIRLAGEIVAELDLAQAARDIAALKTLQEQQGQRIVEVEQQILALRRDGEAAAARGDTAMLAYYARELLAVARGERRN